jgi:pimeloyl-ACP methyl ester carboxylesterase
MTDSRRKTVIALSGVTVLAAAAAGFVEWPVTYYDGFTGAAIWLRGFRRRWFAVNGYRLHCLVGGPEDGPAVVLVHGLGGRSENWRNLAPYFARAGYRVFMPDLLGFGRSPMPEEFSYSMRDQASLVIALIRTLGYSSVELGGWSMGGWIVQLVAGQAPELVRHLMLFNSAGLRVRPKWNPEIFTPSTPEQLECLHAIMEPDPKPIPGFLARGVLRACEPRNWVIRRALNAMYSGRDVTNDLLPTLKMPVFIGWGEKDECIGVKQAAQMHCLIPDSELHIIPDCGHLAPLDCARKLGPRAVVFLKKPTAQSADLLSAPQAAVLSLQPSD